MADDDIYGSKAKYERFKANLSEFGIPPERRTNPARGGAKYYCKNRNNFQYFRALFAHFEARDLSYVRRHRLIQSMRLICHLTTKPLEKCERSDVDQIVTAMHTIYHSPKTKETFIQDIKHLWRLLFPEQDQLGRPDDTIVPYVVRHLSARVDRSRQKRRKDKLSWEEFERLVNYFSADVRMQAYLTLALESLGRPQELLYLKIEDVELHDDFAKVFISEHGKEGIGLLQCIDSYPYVVRWLEEHPYKSGKNAYLFINLGNQNRYCQMKPGNINKLLRTACRDLGIDKPITCYSLKRSGVTLRRLRGDSDMEIQHAARWTSTKQLKTYDLSSQDEAFSRELEKRGIIKPKRNNPKTPRRCTICNRVAGLGQVTCAQCRRPLDRQAVRQEHKKQSDGMAALQQQVRDLTQQLASIQQLILPAMASDIRSAMVSIPGVQHHDGLPPSALPMRSGRTPQKVE